MLFCYALTEKHWVVGGAVNNGGLILRWGARQPGGCRGRYCPPVRKRSLRHSDGNRRHRSPHGSEGLIFPPLPGGGTTLAPVGRQKRRGQSVLPGPCTTSYTKGPIIRAVLEGIDLKSTSAGCRCG